MSFSIPKNVPSFANPQRVLEDRVWGTGVTGRTSVAGGFFGPSQSLPMYKDKPYAYPPSQRVGSLWRRKRVAAFVLVVLAILYYLGAFSGHHDTVLKPTQWSWLKTAGQEEEHDWSKRRDLVTDAFKLSWDAYERYAWGYDEFHPVSKTAARMVPKGMGWIIIDALDTMMLMNLTSRLVHAREWIANSLTYDQNHDVSTFETTIRMVAGLLSAHYLSNEFPNMAPLTDDDPGSAGEDLYLEKAKDLADRVMSAFETQSGIPYASFNPGKQVGLPSHEIGGVSSTAEATTLQLEFKYLSKLTGEKYYWDRAEQVMEVVDSNGVQDGLVPVYIDPETGKFRGDYIRLGSRGDSYYEYLIKQYLQTSEQEPIYLDMWNEALGGVRKHLVTYSEPSGFTIIGERPVGIEGPLMGKMDHLVCFMPGTIALAATGGLTEAEARQKASWTAKKDEEMKLARELMQTCWGMYKYMATGLAAEITYFHIADPPKPESAAHRAPDDPDPDPKARWREDFIVHKADAHNLQRPETVESLFYMWRITGDAKYRDWGWDIFRSFMNYTAVADGGGFTSLSNANVIPPTVRDNQESYWLAETLKYLYLLFSPDDLLPLHKVVINTEGHILPRFQIGQLFSTGWKRKARDANGKIVA